MDLRGLVRDSIRGRLARDFSWVGGGQVATLALRVAGVRILTELIDPSAFGVVGLTIGIAILARNFLCAPILEASYRFFAEATEEGRISEHRALLARMLRMRALLAAGVLSLGGVAWGIWTGSTSTIWSFAAVAPLTFFESLRMFELRLLNAARRQRLHAGWTLADEALRLGAAVLAIHVLGPAPASVLLGYAVGVLAGIALFWRARVRAAAIRRADDSWRRQRQLQVTRYAMPLSLLAIIGWLFNFSDRYFLAGLVGTDATGVYVAAYGLASQPFLLVANILGLTFRPLYNTAAVQHQHLREQQVFRLWLTLTVAVVGTGALLVSGLAEPLTRILLAEEYRGAAVLLPWIGAAYALQACRQLFDAVVLAGGRTSRLVVVQVVAAPISVALYLLLIPRLEALGAAIATLGAMAVALTAAALLSGAIPRLLVRRKAPDGDRNAPDPRTE